MSSFESAQAEARRLAGLLAEKEVEKLKKALEEGGEVADQLDAQLKEALRRLEERAAQQQQQQQQQAAPADSTEMEEVVEALNKELHSVRSYCTRLERSQQHARNELESSKWVIIDLTWQLQQAELNTPAWFQQQQQQRDRAASRERRVAAPQQQARRR